MTLMSYIFGRINWSAPPWLNALNNLRKIRPSLFYATFIGIIFTIGVFHYYQSLPQPISVKAEFGLLGHTPNRENAKPDNLKIQFVYDLAGLNKDQKVPHGSPSVARIDLLGKEVQQGIRLSPSKKGRWIWSDDQQLTFTPESDWAPGINYEVEFDASIFVTEANLSDYNYEFSTPNFLTSIDTMEFYQDPEDISVRRVISTLRFSHPVDKQSLQQNLTMSMRTSGSEIDKQAIPYAFEVSYDKNLREAYVQSKAIQLPKEPNYMKLEIDAGVKALFGGEANTKIIDRKILIPDIYSFLKISQTQVQIVRNDKNQPEQVLMLEFTDEIDQSELVDKFQIYLLPKNGEANGKNYWRSPREVSQKLLSNKHKIDFRMINNEKSFSKHYSFLIDVPENRSLYFKIDKGLKSVNRFVLASFYDSVITIPSYPKEVKIAGEGSLLTHSGDHKLSILSRGVPALKYSVGRLMQDQIYHLMTQTYGDINNPSFSSWDFKSENIAEFDHKIVDMVSLHPKKSNYSSLDLSQFIPQDRNRLGLFFIKVQGWDRENNQNVYGAEDSRLVLITDLGLIVKNNADKTHDVFVQSIKTGKPVVNASIELLGKNGIPLYSKVTSNRGHANFPSTRDFKNEKQPTVYVVKTKNDISFIPFERYSRQINLSKFDIGGVNNTRGEKSLNAYLFSDRGIYRPGETINIGSVVKNFDFSNVENIPLELVIRGPRNNEVKVEKINLAEFGFFDFQYQTQTSSDTGRYSVALHLVRNNKHRGREIGSVNFKVEEFQPDTMKIESNLVDIENQGWSDSKNIQVKVSLHNLFGLPAQNRDLVGRVIIKPAKFAFKKFKQYQFTTPFFEQKNTSMRLDNKLPTQKTDADGIAIFDIDLKQFSQGSYRLHFIAEGFEPGGGRSVASNNTVLIAPLSELVGYKADGKLDYIHAKSKRNIEFIAINKSLNQIAKSDLTIKFVHVETISTLVKQYNGVYKYQSVKKEKEVSAESINFSEKGYSLEVDTNQPGDFAVEIIDEKGRRLSRVEYTVVGDANLSGKIDKNAELQLKLNKSDYLPGETIEMSIKAPYAGAGLITIENDKVRHFKWFKSEKQSSLQTIKLPEGLEGNAYVNVAFVRDISSKEIFTSPLSYAVKPFSIDKSQRRIDLTLEVKDRVRPGKPMEIKYSASKESKMIIFAIDEGILQVAKYKRPDPINHFLKKRALAVDTLQIIDLILPDFQLLKSLSASGGDMGSSRLLAKNINPFGRKTDKPAVYWSGIVSAGTKAKTVIFEVPDTFSGSLRVMAVAVASSSVGAAQKSTLVRGPFVISPKLLTHVAPGDEFIVTVGVSNIVKGSGKNAELIINIEASKHLTLLDPASAKLKVSEGDEGSYSFKVKANANLGNAELKFKVSYKNEESQRTASLSVRPAMAYSSTFESGFEKSGSVVIDIKRSLYPDLAEQQISASASPLLLVTGLTSYLDTYPHGCTEQVVSQAFPLVGLMTHPAYAPHVKNVDLHFSHAIDKLRERQLADGGFAFWPGHHIVAEYPSIYVMHFLVEASSLGYPVPLDMLNRGTNYLLNYVAKASNSIEQARNRANAIYLLTRLGNVTTNYLVDLEEQLNKEAAAEKHLATWRQDILAVYMAATYQLLQKDQLAEKLITEYRMGEEKLFDANFNSKTLVNNTNRENTYQDFQSVLTRDAQYIYLLSKHFEWRAKSLTDEDLLKLTSRIFKGEYNTIASSYSILALGAYSKLVLKDQFDEQLNFSIKNSEINVNTGSHKNKETNEKILQVLLTPFASASYPVTAKQLEIKGNNPIYFVNKQSGFDQSGFDQSLPKEAIREGIEIQREFVDNNGNEVTNFAQGQELTVRLRVRSLDNAYLTNVAVIDLLPGGFEVIRSSIEPTAYNWRAAYIDIREDRVIYYGDFDSNITELTYRVKLTASGTFVIPPSVAESMYDRSIRGMSKAGTFVVTRPNHSKIPTHKTSQDAGAIK